MADRSEQATRTPPACSWRTTSRGGGGARKAACRNTRSGSRRRAGRSTGCWRRRPSTARWAARATTRGSSLRLPDVGDEVFGFRLRQPLGEGAFARVFLAEQADLAGRPVVLKITAIEGSEPQTLAQLQHTNIVPIYSLHEDQPRGPAGRLHALLRRGEPLGGPVAALGRFAVPDLRRAVRPRPGGGRVAAARLAPEGEAGRRESGPTREASPRPTRAIRPGRTRRRRWRPCGR